MPNDDEEKHLLPRKADGRIDVDVPIDADLYAYADQVEPDTALAAFDTDFHRQELARDTEGIPWRPHELKVNHRAGTFDFADLGLKDYSPDTIKLQVIAHSPNRALWRADQDGDDQLPVCSSADAETGSVVRPDGTNIKCANCAFGQWWEPETLLLWLKKKGESSVYGKVRDYINRVLAKRDSSLTVESYAEKKPGTNIPPPCKETRRIFALVYDHQKRGFSSQPVVIWIPPTSIKAWDDFRQDLSLRTHYVRGKPIPATLITSIISVSLATVTTGAQTYSLFKFDFDRIAAPQATELCRQIREDYSESVMHMQVQRSTFEPDRTEDPLETIPPASQEEIEKAELPDDVDFDDEGNMMP